MAHSSKKLSNAIIVYSNGLAFPFLQVLSLYRVIIFIAGGRYRWDVAFATLTDTTSPYATPTSLVVSSTLGWYERGG